MNILRALAAGAVLTGTMQPILAQNSVQPLAVSRIEAGWTSNAEQSANGRPDRFVTHAHEIGFAASANGVGLRGAIGLEQTRFDRAWRENDWAADLDIAAQAALGPTTGLRASLALAYGQEGTQLEGARGPVGTVQPEASATAALRLEQGFGASTLGIGLRYNGVRPGRTRFEGGVLDPVRTAANADVISVGADITHALSPVAALTAGARYTGSIIAEDDQERFGRVPASVLRGAVGVGIESGGGAMVSLRGGVDHLVARGAGIAPVTLPYADAAIVLPIVENFSLRGSVSAQLDVEDPADGLADWALAARVGFALGGETGWGLSADLLTAQRRSAVLDLTIEEELGAEIVARYQMAGMALAAAARYRAVTPLGAPYEAWRLTLSAKAAL